MRKLLFLILIISTLNATAQKIVEVKQVTAHSIHIIGNTFEGIVFTKEFQAGYPRYANDSIKSIWFTPTSNQILLTENIIEKQLKGFRYPYSKGIYKKLKKSYRQYVGFLNKDGNEIIYVNGFPKSDEQSFEKFMNPKANQIKKWYNDMYEVMDGGDDFWHIFINLKTKKIIRLNWNGVA